MTRKRISKLGTIFITFLALLQLAVPLTFAHGEHGTDLDEVVGQLLSAYGVESVSHLDCHELTDEQFEAVGEAVMSKMHPDEEVHEMMDDMMGGEGSESLSSSHIMMGKSYLQCNKGRTGFMGGMMNGGMMGGTFPSFMGGGFGMMGGGNWFGGIATIVFWGLVIGAGILIIQGMVYFKGGNGKEETALDILKKRLAKGEITKKEYEDTKKAL